MRCDTCGAPAVLLANACVFCATPITDSHAPAELLDYLAARLPTAKVKRFGVTRRGPVREHEGHRGRDRVRCPPPARPPPADARPSPRPNGWTASCTCSAASRPPTPTSAPASAARAGSSASRRRGRAVRRPSGRRLGRRACGDAGRGRR